MVRRTAEVRGVGQSIWHRFQDTQNLGTLAQGKMLAHPSIAFPFTANENQDSMRKIKTF